METDLVSLVLHATGWYDTGRSSVTAAVRRSHWDSTLEPRHSITDQSTLFERKAEVFLSPYASESVSTIVQKALDIYMSALDLP